MERKKSGEILGTTESGILQADETTVSGGRLVNVKIWYDNVFSYTNRLVDLVSLLNSSKVKEEDDGIRKRERPPAIEGGLIAKEIFYLEQERKELENAIQENPADRKKETFDKIVDIKLQISRLRENY